MKKGTAIFPGWLFPFVYCVAGVDAYKKIAAAVYLYQVDNDGEWGEISFDFETETAEIIRLAEWDTTVSKKFAKQAIRHLQTSPNYNLPKDGVMIFEI